MTKIRDAGLRLLSEKEVLERDAKRDNGAALLQSVQEIMRGEVSVVFSLARDSTPKP